ncbi:MAG: hypothetical protein AAGC78_08735 [Cellvibrio sp.]|uniref:hypothetical protein n=1 Tax=Cellvibrio sp. TaxID=1965322 RepID=UPI0031B4A290
MDGGWNLVDSGECDAILIYNAEKSFAPFILKPTTQLIMIKRRGDTFSGHVFFKPFRADELVDTLLFIQSNNEPAAPISAEQPSAQQKTYRLKKWPPAELLALHKNYMLLAVYLSRGSKTVPDLVTLSGHNESFCMQFLSELERKNLLLSEVLIPTRQAFTVAIESQPAAKKTFFAQLRDRLGLGKT